LELNDIWLVNPNRSVHKLSKVLKTSFKKNREKGIKRPLIYSVYETLKVEFLVGGACQFASSVISVISPYLLRYLIAFAGKAYRAHHGNGPAPPIGHGIGIVVGISMLQVTQNIATNHFMYRGMMNGGQARAVLMSVIFDKAMVISGRAKAGGKSADALEAPPADIEPGSEEEKKWYKKLLKKKQISLPFKGKGDVSGDGRGWGNGRIINLMSVDTYRIDQAFGMFHMLWCAPISIIVTLILLIVNLGYSALAGFALLVICMPLLARAIRGLFARRMVINRMTDQRVSLTQEILQAVRFVKFFGWETAFLDRIFSLRKREIRSIQLLLGTRNAINAISMSMPIFASMLSFITYSLSSHVLDPAPIFSSLALFNALRMPLNFLPLVLGQVIDALGSFKRIEEFLTAEEQNEDINWDDGCEKAIVMDHADFVWERSPTTDPDKGHDGKGPRSHKQVQKDKKTRKAAAKKAAKKAGDEAEGGLDSASTLTEMEPFKLFDMDFTVGRGELIAVIGTVGSGKSSLLAALAGDMRRTSGNITLGASRAFCPQYAWIQNETVKDNIVFSKTFKQDWYDSVVDACALRPDFDMLPNGDMTEIGERGITVSGGQKQRLNIARAIYFDADIILMDDPLSAVDAHVGRHIMDNAICGLLKGKCRILATHQLHVLNRCDRIIWMEDGRIETIDTFDNLMNNNEDFQKLMASTAVEEEEDEEDMVNEDEIEEEKKVQTKKSKKGAALMQQEERAVASVDWSVYTAYLRAAGGLWVAPLVLFLLVLTQCANIATSLWLSFWTSNKFHYPSGYYVSFACTTISRKVSNLHRLRVTRDSEPCKSS
jgi:ATP-binding cassette subfamily C (CFTR/MRP) protein 1